MKIKEEEKIEQTEDSWDIKRIAVGLTIIFILLGLIFYYLFVKIEILDKIKSEKILGTETSIQDIKNQNNNSEIPQNSKEEVTKIIEKAKEDISKITPDNISSSSSQIQTVINDLNLLQKGTKQPMDVVCDLVCKNK